MGHDITAYKPGIDLDYSSAKHQLDQYDDDWIGRYQSYCEETQIAYLRRSAFSELNQVIYLALGVSDEAYAGCSGNGVTVAISRGQFEAAREILAKKSYAGTERPPNMADDLASTLRAIAFPDNILSTITSAHDIGPELKFVDDCLAYMDEHELQTLDVLFG